MYVCLMFVASLSSVRRANTIAIVLSVLFAIILPETTASDIQFAYDTSVTRQPQVQKHYHVAR